MEYREWLNIALSKMNNGEWFGWRKVDDDGNKIPNDQRMTYENVIVIKDGIAKPTEAEVNAKIQELKDAEKSIKNIQAMADKIAKTELFEDDETLAVEIKEKAEQYYEEYGTLEDALREFKNEDEKEFARQHLTDAYGL